MRQVLTCCITDTTSFNLVPNMTKSVKSSIDSKDIKNLLKKRKFLMIQLYFWVAFYVNLHPGGCFSSLVFGPICCIRRSICYIWGKGVFPHPVWEFCHQYRSAHTEFRMHIFPYAHTAKLCFSSSYTGNIFRMWSIYGLSIPEVLGQP